MSIDLFSPVIDEKSFHHNFARTLEPVSSNVRKVLEDWAKGFVDRDGKFVKEFQTTYNSGFWELYLHAVFKHLGMEMDFKFSSPDFVCSNKNIVIEATTANHAHDDVPEWEKTILGIADEDLFEVSKQSVIRLSNAFDAKAKKYRSNYSQLPHVKDKPFIMAVSNFTKQDFAFHGDIGMQWLLYDVLGMGSVTKKNGTVVPLGIFNDALYEDVSGVLYSSVATFGKARALSDGDESNYIFHAIRIKDNYTPIQITARKEDYTESLCDGLRLFINPFAKYPINIDDFDDDGIRIFVPDRSGELAISCHPEGDLCMRFVQRVEPKK